MGKRKITTTIGIMIFLLVFSLPALAALTTTQIRENSIRINALELKNIKEFVEQNNYEITIVGHTDSIGSNAYNFKLSRRRAEAVKAKLLEFGLAEDRIVGIEAMGEEQPIATNETAEGRAQNRRVEFKLVQRETVQGTRATPEKSESK